MKQRFTAHIHLLMATSTLGLEREDVLVLFNGVTHSMHHLHTTKLKIPSKRVKGKGFPYSILSVGPGADPGVLQVTV